MLTRKTQEKINEYFACSVYGMSFEQIREAKREWMRKYTHYIGIDTMSDNDIKEHFAWQGHWLLYDLKCEAYGVTPDGSEEYIFLEDFLNGKRQSDPYSSDRK